MTDEAGDFRRTRLKKEERMRRWWSLACAVLAGTAAARDHAPMRPATESEKAARAAVVHADYRYDDLLWENDRTAHRIYGHALEASEPPSSSGIDAWGKRVRWPFMDRQLRTGDQHADNGEGLDFYNVGTGRGAGGLGIWRDNKLWTSRNYVSYRIWNAGPQIADFMVDYAPWPIDAARSVSETRRFTLPAGTNFTRMVSTLRSSTPGTLIVGIGITKRATDPVKAGAVTRDTKRARLTWWGPTDPAKGTMAVAVMVDPRAFAGFAEDADNYLILVRAAPGRPIVYFTGAAWDRGGDFADQASWQRYVDDQTPDFTVPPEPRG